MPGILSDKSMPSWLFNYWSVDLCHGKAIRGWYDSGCYTRTYVRLNALKRALLFTVSSDDERR